jgi:hypothetical protein
MKVSKYTTKQLDNTSPWLYAQEVKQERKQSRELRNVRRGKKNIWQSAD